MTQSRIARSTFALFVAAATSTTALANPSAPDGGFGNNGIVIEDFGGVETGGSVFQLSTGKLLLVGNGNGANAGQSFTRYNRNGTKDGTFGSGGTVAGHIGSLWGLTILPDDRMIAATNVYSGNLTHLSDAAVARYTAAGALVNSFGTNGVASFRFDPVNPADEQATNAIELASGKILVVGYLWRGGVNFDIGAVRLNANGSLDSTFADGGYFTYDFKGNVDKAWRVFEQSDNHLVIYGEIADPQQLGQPTKVLFMRLTPNGQIDPSFGPDGSGLITIITDVNSDTPGAIKRLANGKYLFAIGGTAMWTVGKLNANGTLDTTFGTSGIAKLSPVMPDVAFPLAQTTGLDVQADGRIVVGGSVSGFTAQFQLRDAAGLARFEANGTPDTTFNNGSAQRLYTINQAAPDSVANLLVQDDGRILMGGYYPNGVDDRWMLRVNGEEPMPTTTTTTIPTTVCGDANGDGVVNVSDALAVLRAAVGLGMCPLSVCDVNGDGVVNTGDALRVLRFAVGQSVDMNCA